MVGLQMVELKEGEFITGRFSGAKELKLNPSTFYKYLKMLETMQMVVLKSSSKMTVVSIENWAKYQDRQNEKYQQNDSKITATYQQRDTNNNVNNGTNGNTLKDIVAYLNKMVGKNFKDTTPDTKKHINARLKEGYQLDDFIQVIDKKSNQWKGTNMEQYLRPSTLFGSKFESYLNELVVEQPKPTGKEWRPDIKKKANFSAAYATTSKYTPEQLEAVAQKKRDEHKAKMEAKI